MLDGEVDVSERITILPLIAVDYSQLLVCTVAVGVLFHFCLQILDGFVVVFVLHGFQATHIAVAVVVLIFVVFSISDAEGQGTCQNHS